MSSFEVSLTAMDETTNASSFITTFSSVRSFFPKSWEPPLLHWSNLPFPRRPEHHHAAKFKHLPHELAALQALPAW